MRGKLVAGTTGLLVLLGVPVAAEFGAGTRLDRTVRAAVQVLAPGATITRADAHGRPFLTALLQREVSSAYADVRGPDGTTTLIVQRLHRDAGWVSTVLWFTRVTQPVPLVPVKTSRDAYTPTGTAGFNGSQIQVTYRATVGNGQVSLRPTATTATGRAVPAGSLPVQWTPHPVKLLSTGPVSVRAVSVGEHDITVELEQKNVDVRRAFVLGLPS